MCDCAGRVEDIHYSSLSSISLRTECADVIQDVSQLIAILHEFAHFYSERAMEVEDLSSGPDLLLPCPVTRTGAPGRPTIIISQAHIETLVEMGFNYRTIARMFGVSHRTLLRRRSEHGLPVGHSFTDITDADLDAAVRSISQVSRLVM